MQTFLPRSLLLGLVLLLGGSAPASAILIVGGANNMSRCVTDNTNNAGATGSNSIAYVGNENHELCNESGTLVDNNGIRIGQSVTGSGTADVDIRTFAGAAVDSAIGAKEYTRGEIRFSIPVTIDVPSGWTWSLDIDQSILGLLAIKNDGAGSGDAGITNVSFNANGNPFNLAVSNGGTLASSSTATRQFSGSRTDTLNGVGDALLTLAFAIDIDAWSACGGFGCLGDGDEAGVLLGYDMVIGDSFLSSTTVDDYSTWSRNPANDGYFIGLSLTAIPEPGTLALLGAGLLGLSWRGRSRTA